MCQEKMKEVEINSNNREYKEMIKKLKTPLERDSKPHTWSTPKDMPHRHVQ